MPDPEIQTIALPIGLVNKMLEIIQGLPFRQVSGVMAEIQSCQAVQAKKQETIPDTDNPSAPPP